MTPTLLERQILRTRNGLAYLGRRQSAHHRQPPRPGLETRQGPAVAIPVRRPALRAARADRAQPGLEELHPRPAPRDEHGRLPDRRGVRRVPARLDPTDPADAENTLETYVDDYIPDAIEALLEEADADELTLIGYCYGGVLTLLLAAAHPEVPVRNLMVMATPCDYREMGFMSNMFRDGRLNPEDVVDETGLVPASALDEGFQSLKPTDVRHRAGQLLPEPVERRVRRGIPRHRDLGAGPGVVPGWRVPPDRRAADPPERAAREMIPHREGRGPAAGHHVPVPERVRRAGHDHAGGVLGAAGRAGRLGRRPRVAPRVGPHRLCGRPAGR